MSIIFDVVAIVLFLNNDAMIWVLLLFVQLFFSIYLYIKSIDFQIGYINLSGAIIAINYENFMVSIEVGEKVAVCMVTDIFCRSAIKKSDIHFTGGSHISGTAYGLFRQGHDVISFFKIFHVEKIEVKK